MGRISLGQKVRLVGSGEEGTVIGTAQYLESKDQCLVRYVTTDGRLTENWWGESAIEVPLPLGSNKT